MIAENEQRNRRPNDEVEHTEERKKKHTFKARYFRLSIADEKLDEFRLLDSVGKSFYVAGKMRLQSKKDLDNIFNIPDGAFDADRRRIVDAMSEA